MHFKAHRKQNKNNESNQRKREKRSQDNSKKNNNKRIWRRMNSVSKKYDRRSAARTVSVMAVRFVNLFRTKRILKRCNKNQRPKKGNTCIGNNVKPATLHACANVFHCCCKNQFFNCEMVFRLCTHLFAQIIQKINKQIEFC